MERGLLSGKYKPGVVFPPGDHRSDKKMFSPEYLGHLQEALAKIEPVAMKHRASLSQVITNCTFHRPGITAALVGARNADQAKENAHGAELTLSNDERELIVNALAGPQLQRPLYED